MIVRINPSAVPVTPMHSHRILPHFFNRVHLERRFVHRKQLLLYIVAFLRLGSMRSRARGAGAFIAQIGQRVIAMMPVSPIDLDAGGLGDRDMLGIDVC